MNVDETIAIIEALKAAGAVHFKSHDFEVHMRRGKLVRTAQRGAPARVAPPPQAAEQVTSVVNAEDTAKAEELIRTLRNPEKLMDAIFPDGAGGLDGI